MTNPQLLITLRDAADSLWEQADELVDARLRGEHDDQERINAIQEAAAWLDNCYSTAYRGLWNLPPSTADLETDRRAEADYCHTAGYPF